MKTKTTRFIIATILVAAILLSAIPLTFLPKINASVPASDTFSIMQISDTQFLASSYPSLFGNMTQWIVNNSASYTLKMVIHTGDIVDNINGSSGSSSDPGQWSIANDSMSSLLNANIPYCWDAGNHDQIPWNDANGTWLGSNYTAFNATMMHSKVYWVGDMADSKNTAVRFTYNSYDFLIINIEYMATNATLDWMKDLINNYNSSNIIVAAHTYLNKNAGYGFSSAGLPGEVAWCNNLKTILDGYPKVFLTLSGHDPTGTANMTRVGNREEIYFDRQTINSQTGAAAVRIYTFNLTSMKVDTSTYAYNNTSNSWGWLTDTYNQFNFNVNLNGNNWSSVTSRALKGYANLQESVWQKNASIAPNGLYDKIGLHRLVNPAVVPKAVVFLLPGTYLSGEGWISNPTTDSFTKTENDSQAIYWANRGFDVYAIDYRTHFVPTNLNASQLSFMGSWGYDQWISDIKEGVNKAKEVSGVDKVFLAGFSFGGRVTMYYAAKYWQDDLKGLILLDGGTNIKTANPTNTYNLTAVLKQENDTGKWALEAPNLPGTAVASGWLMTRQYAAQNPGAPAEYPIGTPLTPTINPVTGRPWTNITEFSAYAMNGPSANITGGFTNVTVLSQVYSGFDRYWPDRLNLEANAVNDWTNCPYVANDYNEHYANVNVPIIAFTSELFGLSRGNGAVQNTTTNVNTKNTLLLGYGHMDVYCGIYSVRDVSEPTYQWLLSRFLTASIIQGNAATISTTNSITLNVSTTGGSLPLTYQWYEGTTEAIGQTLPQLTVRWTNGGVHNYFCAVKDSMGNTVNTPIFTLTVTDTSTPTPQPSQESTSPTTTPAATPTLKPIQTPTTTPSPTTIPSPTLTIVPSPTATTTDLISPINAAYIVIAAVTIVAVLSIAVFASRKRRIKVQA
jgi:pimeloyl-ACP methyl ester carboxylesterase